jgi:phosphoribosylamine--glycine ligase
VHVGSDVALATAFARDVLAEPGSTAIVEAYLDGPEVSLFALSTDAPSCRCCRRRTSSGSATATRARTPGGMGAYAPLAGCPPGSSSRCSARCLQPVVDELARRGTPFSGLLYAGLAMTSTGPQVIEFNCRFGDPETQVVLALLETPLPACCTRAPRACCGRRPADRGARARGDVVVAAERYPAPRDRGPRRRSAAARGRRRACTPAPGRTASRVVSAGGRVLSVTAVGPDLGSARERAYDGVAAVRLRGAHWRTDIARAAAAGEVRLPG